MRQPWVWTNSPYHIFSALPESWNTAFYKPRRGTCWITTSNNPIRHVRQLTSLTARQIPPIPRRPGSHPPTRPPRLRPLPLRRRTGMVHGKLQLRALEHFAPLVFLEHRCHGVHAPRPGQGLLGSPYLQRVTIGTLNNERRRVDVGISCPNVDLDGMG
jgi:hypothetical protein